MKTPKRLFAIHLIQDALTECDVSYEAIRCITAALAADAETDLQVKEAVNDYEVAI